MADTVIVTESVSDVIINTEENNHLVTVTEPTGSNTVTVTEQPEKVLVTEESQPVSVYISHGGSAYIDAVNAGFVGTEVDWINSIFASKADKSYVDSVFSQNNLDWPGTLASLESSIAATYATKIEVNNLQSWVTQQIALYDQDVQQDLSQYATSTWVQSQIDLENGYMIQRIDTLEANLGTNAAIIQKINEVVATETNARATQIDTLEANFALSYATITRVNQVESDAQQARATLGNSLTTSFNNRIDSEVLTLQQSISSESSARATDVTTLTANYNNLTASLNSTNIALSDESTQRATAIQSLTAQVDQNYQAQSTLIQDVSTETDGNTTAIAGFRTAITGDPLANQSQAELGLETIRDQSGDAFSRAYMTVSSTVGGVTYVTGITADSSNNSLAFMANSISIRDSAGDPQFYWDATDGTWIFNGRLIIGGNVVDTIEDLGEIATPVHYILPIDGMAIKNGVGSLTLEARKVVGSNNSLSPDGYLRDKANPTVNLGNTATFTGADITGTMTIELVVAGAVVDSVALVDVLDGEGVVGEIINERIAWVQDDNGNWPADLDNTVSAKFYKNGTEVASGTVNLNLQTASGFINGTVSTETGTTATFIGNGTNQVTVKFTHALSGQQVSETFFSVFKGDLGPEGPQGPDGENAPGTFADYFDDSSSLTDWINYSGAGELSLDSDTYSGGTSLEVGNNSGNDQAWLIHKDSIPYDPSRTYKIRVVVKRVSGSGTCYFGAAGRNATDTGFVNGSGANTHTSQNYTAGSNVTVGTSWTVYEGLLGADGQGLHANAKYFRPLMLLNYSATAGIHRIDSFTVEPVGEKGGDGSGWYYLDLTDQAKPATSGAITTAINVAFNSASGAGRQAQKHDVAFVTWATGEEEAYTYTGTSWAAPSLRVNGDILADGAVIARHVAAGSIDASKLSLTNQTKTGSRLTMSFDPGSEQPIDIVDNISQKSVFSVQYDPTSGQPSAFVNGTAGRNFISNPLSITPNVKKSIYPYYLSTGGEQTTSDLTITSGETKTLTVNSGETGLVDINFELEAYEDYGPVISDQNWTAPKWQVQVKRMPANVTIYDRIFEGIAKNWYEEQDRTDRANYNNEPKGWYGYYKLDISAGFTHSAPKNESHDYVMTITRISGTPTTLKLETYRVGVDNFETNDLINSQASTPKGEGHFRDKETGFTQQWGTINIDSNSTRIVTFPISFVECANVQLTGWTQTNTSAYEQPKLETASNTTVTIRNSSPELMTVSYLATGVS